MANYNEIEKKFLAFKEKYQHLYEDYEWKFIEENFHKRLGSRKTYNDLMQIYGKLDIYPSPANFYYRHLKLVENNFPLDGNVVEVSSGRFPIFAEALAQEQLQIGKGTVTLYEPLLAEMKPKYPNMTLHKEIFTEQTDLTGADLVIGIHPCQATWAILKNAIKNKKDFYVAMCGCDHSPGVEYMDYFEQSPYLFQEDTIELAEQLLRQYPNGHLEVIKDYHDGLPILYNKK